MARALAFASARLRVSGEPFQLRPYQEDAVAAFYAGGGVSGGSGVVVLPCGAGKTVVGIGAMAAVQRSTLILTPNTVAVRQWIANCSTKPPSPPIRSASTPASAKTSARHSHDLPDADLPTE